MKNIIISLIVLIVILFMVKSHAEEYSPLTDSLETELDSLDISPYLGEKFIRYMEKPEKKRRDDIPVEKKFYVLEVSTDVMEDGIRRAMPFTSIIRDGKEYFVAFEVVTSFDTKEEVLKYAEDNGITDIDLSNYEDVAPDSD
jgi:hypothetical protein